jgi:hypothetical protein
MESNNSNSTGPVVPQPTPQSTGIQAVIAATTALAGLVLMVDPTNPVAQGISRALPQIGAALPPILAACGTIVAAISQPPRLRR